MKDITKQEFDAIIRLSPEERYAYFIKRICDWEQIWTLYSDDNLVLNEDKKGKLEVFYFRTKPLPRIMRMEQKTWKKLWVNAFI